VRLEETYVCQANEMALSRCLHGRQREKGKYFTQMGVCANQVVRALTRGVVCASLAAFLQGHLLALSLSLVVFGGSSFQALMYKKGNLRAFVGARLLRSVQSPFTVTTGLIVDCSVLLSTE